MKSKIVSYKSFIKPWLSRDLLNSINYKLLFKKYKLEIIPFEFYRDYNNSVSKLVKKEEARFQYYKRRLIAFKSDMRQTWRTVNTLFGRSTDKTNKITLLDDNGEDVNDPKSASNMFCDYFSTIATKLNEKPQQQHRSNEIHVFTRQCFLWLTSNTWQCFLWLTSISCRNKKLIMSLPNKGFNKNPFLYLFIRK